MAAVKFNYIRAVRLHSLCTHARLYYCTVKYYLFVGDYWK